MATKKPPQVSQKPTNSKGAVKPGQSISSGKSTSSRNNTSVTFMKK